MGEKKEKSVWGRAWILRVLQGESRTVADARKSAVTVQRPSRREGLEAAEKPARLLPPYSVWFVHSYLHAVPGRLQGLLREVVTSGTEGFREGSEGGFCFGGVQHSTVWV